MCLVINTLIVHVYNNRIKKRENVTALFRANTSLYKLWPQASVTTARNISHGAKPITLKKILEFSQLPLYFAANNHRRHLEVGENSSHHYI